MADVVPASRELLADVAPMRSPHGRCRALHRGSAARRFPTHLNYAGARLLDQRHMPRGVFHRSPKSGRGVARGETQRIESRQRLLLATAMRKVLCKESRPMPPFIPMGWLSYFIPFRRMRTERKLREIRNQEVIGSSPIAGSTQLPLLHLADHACGGLLAVGDAVCKGCSELLSTIIVGA